MRYTILGIDETTYKRKIYKSKILVSVLIFMMLAINILLCLLRNENNHYIMLVLNIIIDLAIGWFLVAYISFSIIDKNKILKLYIKNKEKYELKVSNLHDRKIRIQGIDCFKVEVKNENIKFLYLPIQMKDIFDINKDMVVKTVSSIIVEAEYER